jgi:transposase
MKKKITYSTISIKQVDVSVLLPLLAAGCLIAIDVAKEKFVVALATLQGEILRLIRFHHPVETHEFLALVGHLVRQLPQGTVQAALEPTGTYGDALRYQLERRGVPVKLVSPKRTHDSKELFDGVASLHDGKSAVLIARLHGMALSSDWKTPPEATRSLRALVEMRRVHELPLEPLHGRLEAMLARHWPEFGRWLDVREQRSALTFLAELGGPEAVQRDPERAREVLRAGSRGRLSQELIDGVVSQAETLGMPMTPVEQQLLQTVARAAVEQRKKMSEVEEQLNDLVSQDEAMARVARMIGRYTAATLFALVDPRQYDSARAFEKACGLNLREKSSGEMQGRKSITKRGPAEVRRVMHLCALRKVQEEPLLKAWYEQRKSYKAEARVSAVVAVTRKLVRAVWHVARGTEFDVTKLVDVRRLSNVAPKRTPTPLVARTSPRSVIRQPQRRSTQSAPPN